MSGSQVDPAGVKRISQRSLSNPGLASPGPMSDNRLFSLVRERNWEVDRNEENLATQFH